jgi:hypothetical protein
VALLHEHELHYRCNFELLFSSPIERTWDEFVRLVRSWASSRIPTEHLNPGFGARWFFAGGEWRGTPRLFLKSERCVALGTDLAPQYWAIRFEHPDSHIGVRQWRTDVGITLTGENRCVFSLSTIHWLLAGFIGQEPGDPLPTAPRIVSDVLNHRTWEARSGSEKLGTMPFLLRDGTGKLLLNHLEDADRKCPLVLIAKDFATGSTLLEPRKLARLLAGAAVVWESESSWVDKELEQLLGRSFSCWNGMVRVYQPRVNLQMAQDAKRHRYFDKDDIETLGVAKVEELLVRGIVRRSRIASASAITTIEDVHAKQAQTRFAEELKKATRGSQEWTSLLESEVERQTATIKQKDEEIALLQAYGEDADELRDEVARLKYEHGQALARAQEAESVRSGLAAQASLLKNLDHLPSSMAELVNLVGKVYPDKLIFTEKAVESTKSSTLKSLNAAWKCLRAMATTFHDLHFQRKLPLRDLAKEFRNSTGFELAVGESERTRKDKRLGALRRDVYRGQEIDISTHVKHGTSPGNMLRVHYHADQREKVLVVGHCGDHLDTVRTN